MNVISQAIAENCLRLLKNVQRTNQKCADHIVSTKDTVKKYELL